MMQRTINARLPDLIIPEDGDESNVLRLRAQKALAFFAIDAAHTGTISLEVSADGENFVELESGGLSPGEVLVVDPAPFSFVRLVSSGSEAGDRTVQVMESA